MILRCDDRERDEIVEATLLSLTLHKTALAAKAQENVGKVQEKLIEEEIEKMVEGEEDKESYASEFVDSMLNDNKDDEKDEDEDVEKTDDAAEEKDNDDHTNDTLVRTHATVNKDREVDPINVPELISKEFATNGPKMIEELFRQHTHNTTLNLYPTISSSTIEISTVDLQQQLYLNMKLKPQDQEADPELWEILNAKVEKP
ncbi:hypothetical protein Tco_0371883 [Tanacetum coccineum]